MSGWTTLVPAETLAIALGRPDLVLVDDVGEREHVCFFRHPCMEDHLQQQVAELVLQVVHVAAVDRVGDFVGFFDRVRRDAREILREIPRAATVGRAQPGIEISLDALAARAAQLSKVELVAPSRGPIGKSTVEALQSGVVFGFAGQVVVH